MTTVTHYFMYKFEDQLPIPHCVLKVDMKVPDKRELVALFKSQDDVLEFIERKNLEIFDGETELARAQRWKTEALVVLDEWEKVFVQIEKSYACPLGKSKARHTLDVVKKLQLEEVDNGESGVDASSERGSGET